MTKQQHLKCQCWDCKINLICPKCKKEWPIGTPFSHWLRSEPSLDSRKYGYDNQNLDYIWFAFKQAWFILLEEKIYNSDSSKQQQDTHGIINQLLKSTPTGTRVNTYRGYREVEYRGYFLVQFEITNPNNSKWIKINNEFHDKNDLLLLLRFGKLVSLQEASKNLQYTTVLELAEKLSQELQLNIDIGIAAQYIRRENIVIYQ